MLSLRDGMALYHGSTVEVSHPDLAKCSPHKDFGRGFYLTSSIEQARAFAQIVARRATREAGELQVFDAIVSSYEVLRVDSLKIRTFETANAEWLHCVVAHRRGEPFMNVAESMKRYDAIVGKVANDQTNATILAYLAGAYGEMGTHRADEMCVSLLLPDRLDDQVCLRTEKVLDCIKFLESETL